jgi:hypothetical protein
MYLHLGLGRLPVYPWTLLYGYAEYYGEGGVFPVG